MRKVSTFLGLALLVAVLGACSTHRPSIPESDLYKVMRHATRP